MLFRFHFGRIHVAMCNQLEFMMQEINVSTTCFIHNHQYHLGKVWQRHKFGETKLLIRILKVGFLE